MKVIQISVSKGRKFGLPKFSSVDMHYSVTVELEEGEDPQTAKEKAQELVQSWIDHETKWYAELHDIEPNLKWQQQTIKSKGGVVNG